MKPHLNKGLFSNYYLDELLPGEEEFNVPHSRVKKVLEGIKSIWDRDYLSSLNEPQLRKHFLDKVFEILGWTIDVEPPTPSGEWSRHPDYALFQSKEDLRIAQKTSKTNLFAISSLRSCPRHSPKTSHPTGESAFWINYQSGGPGSDEAICLILQIKLQ